MRPDEMQPVEVELPCRFRRADTLGNHVVKHVLDGRDERWHKVIPDQDISDARDERARGEFGPACIEVAAQYQRLLGQTLAQLCKDGKSHCHSAALSLSPAMEVVATAQFVEAWSESERLFVVARATVRNNRIGRYYIRTGFRPWPRLRQKAFVRAARERAEERIRVRARQLVAMHDGGQP